MLSGGSSVIIIIFFLCGIILKNFNTEGFFLKLAIAVANEGENQKIFMIGFYFFYYHKNANIEYNS